MRHEARTITVLRLVWVFHIAYLGLTCRSHVMAKVMRWTGCSAFYSKNEPETGFFIQISGEVPLTV